MMSDKKIKCIVWDLDGTLWDGVLLESPQVSLRPQVAEILLRLDRRGILHAIASKNDHDAAMQQLKRFGLDEYFLCPQINWGAKSVSIAKIQAALNIGMEAILFIDDQAFERDEVAMAHPAAFCWDADQYCDLLDSSMLQPRFLTDDAAQRRHLYRQAFQRQEDEADFQGPADEFLAGLGMELIVHEATEADLQRAEELTIRTNQLNATGVTYDYAALNALRQSSGYRLLVAEFSDCYGSYGKIGLVVIKMSEDRWLIELILVSCRVMSRGVGTMLLNTVLSMAQHEGHSVAALFRDTGKNKIMKLALQFAGFRRSDACCGELAVYPHNGAPAAAVPNYVRVTVDCAEFNLVGGG